MYVSVCVPQIIGIEPSNIEAIASLGSHHFYNDQPETALKYYRRLLQMGVQNTELWNNIGLCCFYASQVLTRTLNTAGYLRVYTVVLPWIVLVVYAPKRPVLPHASRSGEIGLKASRCIRFERAAVPF